MLTTVRTQTIERSVAEALRIFISAGDFRYKEHEDRLHGLVMKNKFAGISVFLMPAMKNPLSFVLSNSLK